MKNQFGNRLASLSPPNPALRHVSLAASAYALRNPSTRPSMAKKFDPAIIEAEENLLIDYQFLLQELMKQKSVTPTQLAEMAGLSK